MDEKRKPFMNFKIVNAKNLKIEFKKTTKKWLICSLRFKSLAITHTYKRGFVKKKKTRAIKLKILEKHMTSTSLLMFSPEFNVARELCNASVLSSHT